MKVKSICCVGAGYVGGPTMAVIAKHNPEIKITIVDKNAEKIKLWNSDDLSDLPVYEPGLAKIISEVRNKNLFFSTDIDKSIIESEMIFISVNTPTKDYGFGIGKAADLKYVELCTRNIARVATNDKIIVEKSTLPVRTAQVIKSILKNSEKNVNFQILSNPEFLAEGTAINDLEKPDRILIGSDQDKDGIEAYRSLSKIYESWVPKNKIFHTNLWSSELSKLVANAFLAQRVSSINSISALCEKTDAKIGEVSKSIGYDSRIGSKFLNASVGFGGSCFKKDILNLVYICRSFGLDEVADYWEQVIIMNNYQKKRFVKNIISTLFNTITDKKISIFGWAFKKDTNDSRESAAIDIAHLLLQEKAKVEVFDPQVKKDQIFNDLKLKFPNLKINNSNFTVNNNITDTVKNSHSILILTEWDMFKNLDWEKF